METAVQRNILIHDQRFCLRVLLFLKICENTPTVLLTVNFKSGKQQKVADGHILPLSVHKADMWLCFCPGGGCCYPETYYPGLFTVQLFLLLNVLYEVVAGRDVK